MAEELLDNRVKRLEETVDKLRDLPARVDGLDRRVAKVEEQIVQHRSETRDGFLDVLRVIQSSSDATQALYDEGRKEMRELFGDLKKEVLATRTQMRALHEDLVERIKDLRG